MHISRGLFISCRTMLVDDFMSPDWMIILPRMYKLEELDVGMIEPHRSLDLQTLPKLSFVKVGYLHDYEKRIATMMAEWKLPPLLR